MKATSTFLLKSAALVLVASTLNSCRTPKPPQPPPEPPKVEYKYPGEWTGGDKPITQIIVNTDTQRATLYSGEEVVGWTYVASGITSFPRRSVISPCWRR